MRCRIRGTVTLSMQNSKFDPDPGIRKQIQWIREWVARLVYNLVDSVLILEWPSEEPNGPKHLNVRVQLIFSLD